MLSSDKQFRSNVVAVLTWKQRIGLALEGLTYKTLKSLLQRRIGTAGGERTGSNGPVWTGKNYTLYWNMQVVKSGQYPKTSMFRKGRGSGKRRRLADLVLCNENLPEIRPYNYYLQDKPSPLQGTYTKAILAIECKNNNLDYRWGFPSSVRTFDDDIVSRFLWGDIQNILGFDVDWERYAGWQNLFPRAVKVLLMPNFVFTDKAKQDRFVEMNELQKIDVDWRRQTGLMPLSFSPYERIMWRIKRLKLQVLELGYQPKPNRKIPPEVKRRLTYQLKPYVEPLIPSIKRPISTKVIEVSNVKPSNGHTKVSKVKAVRRKKFGSSVSEKRSWHLSKLGYEPPSKKS